MNTADIADGELIARIARDDDTAMEALYGRYHVRLYRFLIRLVRDEAVAEELTNETFMEVWRTAGKFEGKSAPATWMFAIARYRAASLLRRKRDAEIDDESAGQIVDDADTPEVAVQKKDKATAIKICLEQLTVEHREVIDLVYYHGKSVRDVSEIVGIPENTVKTRMYHARRRLSEIMSEAGLDRGWP